MKTIMGLLLVMLIAGCSSLNTTTPVGNTVQMTATPTSTPIQIPVTISYSAVSPSNAAVTAWYNSGNGGVGLLGNNFTVPVSTCGMSTTVVSVPYQSYLKVQLSTSWPCGPTTCVSELVVSTQWNGPATTFGTTTGCTQDGSIEVWGVGQVGAAVSIQ